MCVQMQTYKNNFIINSIYYFDVSLILIEMDYKNYMLGTLRYEILKLFSINLNKFLYQNYFLNELITENILTEMDLLNYIDLMEMI